MYYGHLHAILYENDIIVIVKNAGIASKKKAVQLCARPQGTDVSYKPPG